MQTELHVSSGQSWYACLQQQQVLKHVKDSNGVPAGIWSLSQCIPWLCLVSFLTWLLLLLRMLVRVCYCDGMLLQVLSSCGAPNTMRIPVDDDAQLSPTELSRLAGQAAAAAAAATPAQRPGSPVATCGACRHGSAAVATWLFTGRLHLTHALSAHMSLQSGGPECNLARQLVAGMLDKGFSMTR